MAGMREIRERIASVSEIMKITNAMYLISSSNLKKGFIVLIVNCLFYDLIKNADEELTQTWLGLGLTAIDIILIVLMFRGI